MVNDASRIVKALDEDPTGPEVAEAAAVVAGWARAEEGLYGPLLADPHAYEQVVALVGALVAHLRTTVPDLPDLVAASRRGPALVAEVAPEQALPWVSLEAALRAACAMRHRELLAAQLPENRKERLAEAAASGATWVRIADAGSTAAPVVAPALVVHVASGMAIRCTTEMDEETGGARFRSRGVTVDLATGEVTDELADVGEALFAASVAQRDADVGQLQEEIERLDRRRRVV